MKKKDTPFWKRFLRYTATGAAFGLTALGTENCSLPPPETPSLITPNVDVSYKARNEMLYKRLDAAANPAADEMAQLINSVNPIELGALELNWEKMAISIYSPGRDSQVFYKLGNHEEKLLPAIGHMLDCIYDIYNLNNLMAWEGLEPPAINLENISQKMALRMKHVKDPADGNKAGLIKRIFGDVLKQTLSYPIDPVPESLQQKTALNFSRQLAECNDRIIDNDMVFTDYGTDVHHMTVQCHFKPDATGRPTKVTMRIPAKNILESLKRNQLSETSEHIVNICLSFVNERDEGYAKPQLDFTLEEKPKITVCVYPPGVHREVDAHASSALMFIKPAIVTGEQGR